MLAVEPPSRSSVVTDDEGVAFIQGIKGRTEGRLRRPGSADPVVCAEVIPPHPDGQQVRYLQVGLLSPSR